MKLKTAAAKERFAEYAIDEWKSIVSCSPQDYSEDFKNYISGLTPDKISGVSFSFSNVETGKQVKISNDGKRILKTICAIEKERGDSGTFFAGLREIYRRTYKYYGTPFLDLERYHSVIYSLKDFIINIKMTVSYGFEGGLACNHSGHLIDGRIEYEPKDFPVEYRMYTDKGKIAIFEEFCDGCDENE